MRAEGVLCLDADGKRYLDFSGSAAVNFIGHGVPEIGDAMLAQIRQLEFVQPASSRRQSRKSSLRSCSISRANTFMAGRCISPAEVQNY